ncbi:MAG: GDP-mannose 4,6-dehydratase [Acholeplasmataceae bacterium]|jgi:GDPmannose 4,6-dehydratase|nr:GDP-mannose 4,6-dehydratase [Acholeplasmataceae bacterium]
MKTAIITGISGQDGAYLSRLLLEKKYRIIGIIRDQEKEFIGLTYFNLLDKLQLEVCNLLDYCEVEKLIIKYKPNEFYNLAAASSVGKSFLAPKEVLEFNYISVLNILEAIRTCNPLTKFYQASSSEMFGKIEHLPITGDENYHPLSPYAVSKVASHLMTKIYREAYGMHACSGILFNHESVLRGDDFFLKKIIREAVEVKFGLRDYITVGNINQKRDFGYAEDYVKAMFLMMQKDQPTDYIVCSGKSTKLEEILYYVLDYLEVDRNKITIDTKLFRPLEIEDIFGDNSKIVDELGWKSEKTIFDVAEMIIHEEVEKIINKGDLI